MKGKGKGKKEKVIRERSRDKEDKTIPTAKIKAKEQKNINITNTTSILNTNDPKSYENTRELCIENIPNTLSNDKIREIFFIYGDISKFEFLREEVRLL
jgi:hypothetical protein